MLKLVSFLLVVAFAATGLADSEVPLPGPGAPPTNPAPPQPTPPYNPAPTPPTDPYPSPTPWPGNPPQNPGDQATYTLGTGQVGRLKGTSFTFRPPAGLSNINALRITGTNSKLKIKGVSVQFENGEVQNQSALEGVYSVGTTRLTYLYSGRVVMVTVFATSSSVFRKDGSFRIDAMAGRSNSQINEAPGSHEEPVQYDFGDAGAF